MVPNFEHFACRFAPSYPALFVRENLKKTRENSYRCLDMIRVVRKNALLCVDDVLNRDYNFFDSIGGNHVKRGEGFAPLYQENSIYKWLYTSEAGGMLVPHPWRILNHHLGYLQHYIEYVSSLEKELVSAEDQEKIISGVKDEIEEYQKKLNEIKHERREYYNR